MYRTVRTEKPAEGMADRSPSRPVALAQTQKQALTSLRRRAAGVYHIVMGYLRTPFLDEENQAFVLNGDLGMRKHTLNPSGTKLAAEAQRLSDCRKETGQDFRLFQQGPEDLALRQPSHRAVAGPCPPRALLCPVGSYS